MSCDSRVNEDTTVALARARAQHIWASPYRLLQEPFSQISGTDLGEFILLPLPSAKQRVDLTPASTNQATRRDCRHSVLRATRFVIPLATEAILAYLISELWIRTFIH